MNYKNISISIFTGFLFTLSVFQITGCSTTAEKPGQPAAEENASERPHKAFVQQALKKPLEVRTNNYLEQTKEMVKKGSFKVFGAYPLIKEIVLQKDFEGIELLEKKTDSIYVKSSIFKALGRENDEKAKALLRKWALADPDNYELMRYHPNGPELLMGKLEDASASALTRYLCAGIISRMELVNLLPRLRMYVDDKTPVPLDNASWPCTLGGAVKECVERLEILSKNPNERNPIELIRRSEGRISYYEIWIYKNTPQQFAIGDTIRINGKGIESARVHGSVTKEKNGAWRVKEFDENHVVFEAACDAKVISSLYILEITAPDAKEGKVKWEFKGKYAGNCSGEVYGPAEINK